MDPEAGAGDATSSSSDDADPQVVEEQGKDGNRSEGDSSEDERCVPSYPFPSDFQLAVGQSTLGVVPHRCSQHPGGTRVIVLFFPGVHGGVGPCRTPPKNFDEDALYPTLARSLTATLPVDCYRCSWPFMRPPLRYAVDAACRLCHHALTEATADQAEGDTTREIRLVFVGHSLGGAVVMHASEVVARLFGADGTGGRQMSGLEKSTVRVGAVCTLNAALDVRNVRRRDEEPFATLVNSRALMICGSGDLVVPPGATESLYEAFPSKQKRKLVCPDGTHDLFTFKEQLVDEISQLVRDTLGDFYTDRQ